MCIRDRYMGEANQKILKSFVGMINFQGMDIDKALRLLFSLFEIPRDSNLIQRVLKVFATNFWSNNQSEYNNEEEVYMVSHSLLLLSSGKREKITKIQFCSMIINNAPLIKISKAQLELMYERVQEQQFETKSDQIEIIYNRLHFGEASNAHVSQTLSNLKSSIQKDPLYILEKGNTFYKFGRKGKPCRRFVYYSDTEQRIY
eukprot:TRINITY_DN8813_c0_g1_i1.p2 TRINITY_DN8813_c0_g1~~TRINITY_DN8813_c0_g1_i1.p2  ORF type:complete len:202 (+),score=17.41 TRINITY_DN8813_c0_g1_i1:117-722(+)